MTTTDYLADAPDWAAIAGAGPRANALYNHPDFDAELHDAFRAAANAAVTKLVEGGMDPAAALGTYDPEKIAAGILAGHMLVQIEIATAGTDIWQAVEAPVHVTETGFTGDAQEIADAVAADYLSSQLAEDSTLTSLRVRAIVTTDGDKHGEGRKELARSAELPKVGGRPEIGATISTAIGADRLAAVDAWASVRGVTRAEAIRILLSGGLAADPIELHDIDMQVIGIATPDQIMASNDSADGGWIWIDSADRPVEITDERRGDDDEWVPVDANGWNRTDLRKVCVA